MTERIKSRTESIKGKEWSGMNMGGMIFDKKSFYITSGLICTDGGPVGVLVIWKSQ
jgi:hypothetical protein